MPRYRSLSPLRGLVEVAKALACPVRVRALLALGDGEMCVCELVALLGVAASTMSRHMSLLERSGLVAARKEGRWMHYSLPADPAHDVAAALDLVHTTAARDAIAAGDRRRRPRLACR